jgi:formylglycine-generating enzyme required for sulfatase activity
VAAEQEKIRAQAQAEAEARVTAEAQALAKAQADAAAKAREEAAAAAEARKKAEQIADENRRAEAQARVEAQAKAEAELARKQAAEAAQREQERQAAEAKAREVAEQQRQHQLAQEVAFQASREEEQKRAAAAAAAVAPPPIVSQNSNSNLSVASVVEPPAKSDTPMTADRPGFDNTIGIAFVWVPDFPGTAHGAGVGKFEITQREYEQVMHANPSTAPGPDLPVQNVTGYDATNFCATLTDLEYSAGKLPKDWKYTLPSEAQFAYLSKDTRLEDSVTSHNLPKKRTAPQPVGSSGKTNNFGIYDVRGNVWEWCLAQDVGLVPLGGAFDGITETGPWATLGQGARENNLKPQMADNNTGFRVIVVPTAPVTPMHPPQSPK